MNSPNKNKLLNSLNLTEQEMNRIYHDEVPEASYKLINQHEHWVLHGFCAICGHKVVGGVK